jgi:hypothetical protein
VKINPNGKQLVVYRVTTLLFPGKQPIACLKRETTLSGSITQLLPSMDVKPEGNNPLRVNNSDVYIH